MTNLKIAPYYVLYKGKTKKSIHVFVVPGNINSLNSVGTNRLIKEGAQLVNCYEDILMVYKKRLLLAATSSTTATAATN